MHVPNVRLGNWSIHFDKLIGSPSLDVGSAQTLICELSVVKLSSELRNVVLRLKEQLVDFLVGSLPNQSLRIR